MLHRVLALCSSRLEGAEAAYGWDGVDVPPGNPHAVKAKVLRRELRRQMKLAREWDEGFDQALGRDLTPVEKSRRESEEVWLASRITVDELDQEE